MHLTHNAYDCMQGTCRSAALPLGCPLRASGLVCRQQASRLRRVSVRAEDGDSSSASTADSLFASGSGKIDGALTYTTDSEGFQDVFAFAGELPEVGATVHVLPWPVDDTHCVHCDAAQQISHPKAPSKCGCVVWGVQRVNGRVAMWSFAALALGELQSGKTTLQQAVEHPVAAVMFSLLISVASLAPKFASGRSLSECGICKRSAGK